MLPARPSLEQLRKQAKELSRAEGVPLSRAQLVLAARYGFESWPKLVRYVEALQTSSRLEQLERLAQDLLSAYRGDAEALQRLNQVFGNAFTRGGSAWTGEQLRDKVDERLSAIPGRSRPTGVLSLDDARLFLARGYGVESWTRLLETAAEAPRTARSDPQGGSSTPPFYQIDWKENTIAPGPVLSDKDWDTVFSVMKERGITGLNAGGRMTDGALARLSRLDHVTRLNLDGSTRLTDDGLLQLARMPQLRQLDLSGWEMRITDRGLQVLLQLPNLRSFQMCWPQRVSDAGVASLRRCDHLECVDLMGTPTGDGAIAALTGKPRLRHFKTGKAVTDAGLPLLHRFPVFETWQGGEIKYGLMEFHAEPNYLLLDGPFTNQGLASLAGLDGVFALNFFWHTSGFSADGLAPLASLPHLGFLGCDGKRCDDEAMRRIATLPKLRMLMAQGTVAGDDGFSALSRSQTIEYIWGRECPSLGGRGFAALAAMPALRGLAVSCKQVDDTALSTLPRFPALTELMPMDVADEGFRHAGRCERLEALWCMYCRDTTDVATGHIAGLTRLKTYYAGKTRITDKSLELLGRMASLERLEFWECAGLTNAGLVHLAGLPRLREVSIGGSPGVTRDGLGVFPAGVRVEFW